jgi:hypothetical protein
MAERHAELNDANGALRYSTPAEALEALGLPEHLDPGTYVWTLYEEGFSISTLEVEKTA